MTIPPIVAKTFDLKPEDHKVSLVRLIWYFSLDQNGWWTVEQTDNTMYKATLLVRLMYSVTDIQWQVLSCQYSLSRWQESGGQLCNCSHKCSHPVTLKINWLLFHILHTPVMVLACMTPSANLTLSYLRDAKCWPVDSSASKSPMKCSFIWGFSSDTIRITTDNCSVWLISWVQSKITEQNFAYIIIMRRVSTTVSPKCHFLLVNGLPLS